MTTAKWIVLCVALVVLGCFVLLLLGMWISDHKKSKEKKRRAEAARREEEQRNQEIRDKLIEQIEFILEQRLEIEEKILNQLLEQNAYHSGDDNPS